MPIKKMWNHVIEMKKEFVLRKVKVYYQGKSKRKYTSLFKNN